MGFFDYLYIFAVVVFAYITFMIIKRNFESKFTEDGQRKDLLEKDKDIEN